MIKVILLVVAILLPSLMLYNKLQGEIDYLIAWSKVKRIRADKHEQELIRIMKQLSIPREDDK